MKVRAIASASAHSTLAGTLELDSRAAGLAVAFVGASSIREDYAPGAPLVGDRWLVPWSSVSRVEVQRDALRIDLEHPTLGRQSLCLVNFSLGDRLDHHNLFRRRLIVRVACIGFAVVAALATTLTIPRVQPAVTARGGLAVGALTAAGVLLLGFLADRWLAFGGTPSSTAQERFVAELALYFPHVRRSDEPVQRPVRRFRIPPLDSLLPRTAGVLAITLSAGLLAILVTTDWLTGSPSKLRPPQPSADAPRALAVAAAPRAAPSAPAPVDPVTPPRNPLADAASALAPGDPCVCRRSDSVLWRDPIPKLTTLLIDSRLERGKKHQELSLEIAAINNSDESLHDLTLRVEFFEQDPPPSSKMYVVGDRTLYYEGPLAPAKAIKWSVQARGSHFKILPPTQGDDPILGDIGPGGDGAAPTNLVAELLEANHRPVRLHGAMMLAYFGDPRARDAITGLRRALREREAPYLGRLLRATADLRVCQYRALPSEIRACLYNAGAQPRDGLAVQARALSSGVSHRDPVGDSPVVLESWKWPIAGELPANEGRRVRFPLPAAERRNAAELELLVDRADLLD